MIQKMPPHDPQVCGFDRDSNCANCRWFYFPHDLGNLGNLGKNIENSQILTPRNSQIAKLQQLGNLANEAPPRILL